MFTPAEKLNENHRGFTLIELLVGTLIATLVLTALAGLVVTTMNMFLRGSEETAVQDNARTVLNYVGEQVMEADTLPLRITSGDLQAYVMDTRLEDGETGVNALVLDTESDRLYAGSLTAEDVTGDDGPEGNLTLSEQVTGDLLETIADEPERYYLAEGVTGITITGSEDSSLVQVRVSVSAGERTRTVSGRYGMRNYVEAEA